MTLHHCSFVSWELLDDPSQSALCSCCQSRCPARYRREVDWGKFPVTWTCPSCLVFMKSIKTCLFRIPQLQSQICVGAPDHRRSIWLKGSSHGAGYRRWLLGVMRNSHQTQSKCHLSWGDSDTKGCNTKWNQPLWLVKCWHINFCTTSVGWIHLTHCKMRKINLWLYCLIAFVQFPAQLQLCPKMYNQLHCLHPNPVTATLRQLAHFILKGQLVKVSGTTQCLN